MHADDEHGAGAGQPAPEADLAEQGQAILAAVTVCRDAVNALDGRARRAALSALASLFGFALSPKPPVAEFDGETPVDIRTAEWAEEFVAQVLLSDALMSAALRLDESKREIDGIAERLEQAVDDTSRQLEESKARYARLFNRVREGVFACDDKGRFLDLNPAAVELTGFDPKAAADKARTFDEIFANQEGGTPFFASLCKLEHVQNLEREIVRPDGARLHLLLTATLVRDADGTPIGFEGILHDVTERQRLQETLIEGQRVEAVRQMVVTYCHEINQPLTVLCTQVQLLLEQCEAEGRDPTVALAMSDEAAKLAEVMLKIGRIREIHTKPYVAGIEMVDLERSSSGD
jgi:PAS domain S-box-containing protein